MGDVEYEPVRARTTVHCAPEVAFAAFTERFAEWWPVAGHSVGEDRVATVVFEGRAGGRLFERWHDGHEADWGEVVAWEPPVRIVFTWRPNPTDAATEVEVRFSALEGALTRIELEHRGWEALAEGA